MRYRLAGHIFAPASLILHLCIYNRTGLAKWSLFVKYFPIICSLKVCPKAGLINDTSGTIQSPGYPSLYSANLKCSWKIVAPSGYVVKLAIKDMDLQRCHRCYCDSVRVYDGDTGYDPSLGKVCGNTRYTVFSSNRFMVVSFSTDAARGGRGFRASYSMMLKSEGKITR